MQVLVLVNPDARQVRTDLTQIRARLADGPVLSGSDLRIGRSWEETRDQAAGAAAEGFELVVAVGGDGTVNAVVNGLVEGSGEAERRPTLGVLPLGTGNDLARALAIEPNLEGGLSCLERGEARTMDLLSVEMSDSRRVGANVSAGGFSGRVDESLSDEVKGRWGPLAYLKTAMEHLAEIDRYEAVLEIPEDEVDGPEWRERTLTVANIVVANGRWAAGGIQVAPRARLGDGLLEVVALRSATVAQMGVAAALVAAGDPLEHELIESFRARRLTITSEPAMPFNVDGEPLGVGPVRFEVLPNALRVLVGSAGVPAFTEDEERAVQRR